MTSPHPQQAADIIAAPCLVQRDRAGRSLFISDYPRRLGHTAAVSAQACLLSAGYASAHLGGLALIDCSPSAYQAVYEALPLPRLPAFGESDPALWGLCRILMLHDTPYALQDTPILHQALRLHLLDREQALYALLAAALADALREHRSPPGFGARLLMTRLNKPNQSKEEVRHADHLPRPLGVSH